MHRSLSLEDDDSLGHNISRDCEPGSPMRGPRTDSYNNLYDGGSRADMRSPGRRESPLVHQRHGGAPGGTKVIVGRSPPRSKSADLLTQAPVPADKFVSHGTPSVQQRTAPPVAPHSYQPGRGSYVPQPGRGPTPAPPPSVTRTYDYHSPALSSRAAGVGVGVGVTVGGDSYDAGYAVRTMPSSREHKPKSSASEGHLVSRSVPAGYEYDVNSGQYRRPMSFVRALEMSESLQKPDGRYNSAVSRQGPPPTQPRPSSHQPRVPLRTTSAAPSGASENGDQHSVRLKTSNYEISV